MANLVTLNVFFPASNFELCNKNSLVGLLYHLADQNKQQESMGFEGCGITYGNAGAYFGVGVDTDCKNVKMKVEALIQAGNKVKVNAIGHSRGGIAAFRLAQKLGSIPPNDLEVNLAVFDPVPGNTITAGKLDAFNMTVGSSAYDLTKCQNLNQVLALYANAPANNGLILDHFFSPLRPVYPNTCHVEEDIVTGEHINAQGLQIEEYMGTICFTRDSFPLFARFKAFLMSHGVTFNKLENYSMAVYPAGNLSMKADCILDGNVDDETTNQALKDIYKKTLGELSASEINLHAKPKQKIVTTSHADYLNKHHKQLEKGVHSASVALNFSKPCTTPKSHISRHSLSFFDRTKVTKPAAYSMLVSTLLGAAIGGVLAIPVSPMFIVALVTHICISAAIVSTCALIGFMAGYASGKIIDNCMDAPQVVFG